MNAVTTSSHRTGVYIRFARVFFAFGLVALVLVPFSGCPRNSGIRIGPIGVTLPAGEGTLLRDLFLPKIMLSHSEEVCDLPSENDIANMAGSIGNIDLSSIIALSDLDLVQTIVTATSGDFGFLTEMTVSWIPAPINGQPQDPVVLGTASNPNGFGTQIVLVPTAPVDLIDLIRLNDMSMSNDCPEIELTIDANGVPLNDVEYTVDLDINAYIRVG